MLLVPAIDLKDGKCVRLRQGDLSDATIFSEDPVNIAQKWSDLGARRLHLVDLNGAVAGKPKNHEVIDQILETIDEDLPVQIGGGIRDLETIEFYLDMGIEYVIIGSAAVKKPSFVEEACSAFAGHIIVGLDAKDGQVATDGWTKISKYNVVDLAKRFEDYGVDSIIYTDIGRDGMLSGINIQATVDLARQVDIPIYASGGLSSIEDIRQLCEFESEGIEGVIMGRSLYEGKIDFVQAQDLADSLSDRDLYDEED
ncbi:1-(5-phosphoribosyl)-5-[(5-phosphoribosylamino)methylideneamino]imidazole-4-carboxamide isomerase [Basilea psittacipulmonis]|uniref:1-(5-phosphoribosyl)-5-[(5-phosphoribosylamino)methylideneamino] imidazole-4-carboxamide isomerase n=1 Tax=Basilea psittacipulmonis DSM 24701 TaxID=1072685 RepID=A0A077DJQ6_9BURK|nr:1-(5-phosphoribosyl)-5-[(5-phosphoribosylamino)methylideneamino]imidazole-4-carboxamide isomerase [Basilea psittacipulmonis]AIL33318.1 1-(5-phosphoribosyl)-5-[(5-phosphoribosylamino)methylideneamino] imidazole-4-carboxamide isomerase [Basilea psittacipulmonis DSM 24701]